MKHLWLVSILLKLCLILWDLQACACYRYNFERCRNCTTRKDVMCHIQQMPPTCFPGYDRDIWKDERKWPGAARDMRVSVDRQENGNLMVANFKWKPPYDSSVDELIGFKIQVTVQEEASMSHPVCLFANLSGTDWAQIKDVFDIDFIFNCVETTKLAKVMVYVISVPMPSREHKRIAKNIVMVPGFAWKPKIHVWTTFNNNAYQIHLWFTPLFPGAVYHKVQLHSNQLENSTNLEV
ncbi:uncharacterized protein LOC134236140, partial [Saccostrea cucullata]|uniref:uncharacterized protein LOC134236140 n=1 Tax=Saccostrea cuccullata TaxID=36930 RepID=UPI002ED6612E